jgi:phosphate transport system substrate-binding protein
MSNQILEQADLPTRQHIFRAFHFIALIVMLSFGSCNQKKSDGGDQSATSLSGTISMSGAFALYPLANKWAEEFTKIHPEVRFDISAGGAGKGMADALAGAVDLGMVSRDIKKEEMEKGAFPIAVTKDAVLATVNAKNPAIAVIKEQGMTMEMFRKIFVTNEITTWDAAINGGAKENISVYTRSDACGAAATWAQYLGEEQEGLKGIGVFGDPGLADAVKNDVNGIGFNNVIYVYDLYSKVKYPGMEVVPIDINGDNQITADEQCYETIDQILIAIGEGRYPSPPARELFFVSNGKPTSEVVKVFLNWVLTEGQKFVTETGYIQLPAARISGEVEKLK